MYNIKINGQEALTLTLDAGQINVGGKDLQWDIQPLPNKSFSIIANNKSYVAFLENVDRTKKTMDLRIENSIYTIKIQEPIDLLLEKMGLDISKTQKVEPVKAPMPGLVLKVMVTEGQSIRKGDPVLILEAMKMENVFKASADATVKAIKIVEGQAVEKGEILIELA
ncbi:MAG: biotin/lipoyl-binding protein [Sphingobacteriales bacterium]|nr:MAG: biotin/lipoyl-binding protein [Sphingobacteriales bacterium]